MPAAENPPPDMNDPAIRARKLLSGVINMAGEEDLPSVDGITDYEIQKVLGHGGMGTVYQALHRELGRVVALKVFRAEGEAADLWIERLRVEGRMMAQLHHPNVLGIHDAAMSEDGLPYLVLEYIDGCDLREKLDQEKKLAESEALAIAMSVCAGLAAVHALGIIHRDVKPANVLISHAGEVKVSDFGISKDVTGTGSTSLTMTGTTVGTVDYISPEQASGQEVDARSDIYSVGVLLYEMLAGVTPRGAYEPVSEYGVAAWIDDIVTRCLQRNPDKRYQSAADLLGSLQSGGEVSKPDVCLVSAGSSSQSTSRKAVVSAIVIVALLAAVGWSIFKRQEDDAVAQSEYSSEPIVSEGDHFPPVEMIPAANLSEGGNGYRLLFPIVDAKRDGVKGSWEMEGGALLSDASHGACIRIPHDPGNSYDLRFHWTRLSGAGSLAIFLPTASGMATLEIDERASHLGGLQDLDGQDMQTHGRSFSFKLENGRRYQIDVKVTLDHVSLWVDAKKVEYWRIKDKNASINKFWPMPSGRFLGLGARGARAKFEELKVRKIEP
ncbi:MAG: serine/threonine-protein kinase [Akkermansiaceae bacterium]